MWDEAYIWLNDSANKVYCSFSVKQAYLISVKDVRRSKITFGYRLWAENIIFDHENYIAVTVNAERKRKMKTDSVGRELDNALMMNWTTPGREV